MEDGKYPSGKVRTGDITSRRGDTGIMGYFHTRPDKKTTPNAMHCSLQADILKKIRKDVSEIYVATTTLQKLQCLKLATCVPRSLLLLDADAIL